MTPFVHGLGRLELFTPDLEGSRHFYADVWGMDVVNELAGDHVELVCATRRGGTLMLRQSRAASMGAVSFLAKNAAGVDALAAQVGQVSGRQCLPLNGTGNGFEVMGPQGLAVRIECAVSHQPPPPISDHSIPLSLTHIVINTVDVEEQVAFFTQCLGFKVSDVTDRMTFLRCSQDHHSLAFAKGDGLSLNHAAFEMVDMDGLMYGAGRLIDNGFDIEWGPGRHGPGNNVFCYFVDPVGFAMEYTCGMDLVDELTYVARDAEYWRTFPRRPCRWGVARKPSQRLTQAFSGALLASSHA